MDSDVASQWVQMGAVGGHCTVAGFSDVELHVGRSQMFVQLGLWPSTCTCVLNEQSPLYFLISTNTCFAHLL